MVRLRLRFTPVALSIPMGRRYIPANSLAKMAGLGHLIRVGFYRLGHIGQPSKLDQVIHIAGDFQDSATTQLGTMKRSRLEVFWSQADDLGLTIRILGDDGNVVPGVPEPTTMLLLGLGLLGLAGVRRKIKK